MKSVPAFSLALAGGRAPVCQQRELSKAASAPEAQARACSWTKSFSAASIKVHEGPLFGSCLTDLTASPEPSSRESQARGQTKPRRFLECAQESRRHRALASKGPDANDVLREPACPDIPPATPRTGHKQATVDSFCKQRSLPGHTPRTVDAETVRRISEDSGSGSPLSADRRATPPASTRRKSEHAGKGVEAVRPLGASSQKEWMRQVATRAVNSLIGEMGRNFPVDSNWKRPESADASLLESEFSAPWSTSLDGQRFPLERLSRLASDFEPLSSTAENPPRAASGRKPSRPTAPSAFPTSHTHAIPGGDASSNLEEALAEHKKEELTHDNVAAGQLARTTTPTRLEQMPTPRIPVIPGLVRHHSPLVEQVPSDDEALSMLSANIQRILDEEARRHGIDV